MGEIDLERPDGIRFGPTAVVFYIKWMASVDSCIVGWTPIGELIEDFDRVRVELRRLGV